VVGRQEVERAVRAVAVVVLDEDAEHSLEVAPVENEDQSRHSERAVRTKRSAIAFALGDRIGVLMISTPSPRKTVSKSRVNLLSRSRIRKRTGVARSHKIQTSWRACWLTQAPSGFGVHPARWDTPAAKLDEKEHIQAPQGNRLDGEEVDGEHALRLCAQNSCHESPTRSPVGPRPAWRRRLRTRLAETV